ncbi:Lrp/AsnC family transcriptional regulator [Natrinema amylolyticum]|uniref:Lrp/AsnC family transcriptional regulator n=1 Tax=Natrinema amylolyticum TaxID=2878679 RepID=UPI001CFAAB61|nr:AsnC family transcriptional regulator [Natrinema amylolyticum]
MSHEPLDAIDREILHQLQQNARRPITAIAEAVNVADNTVRNRIDKLEAAGVIDGYSADVNYD